MLHLLGAVGRLFSDKRASVAVYLGLTMAPLMLTLGAAVDYSHVTAARSRLQAAVDSAAIAVAGQPTLTQPQRAQIAKNVVLANLGGLSSTLNPTVSETEPSGVYQVKANATAPTVFMKLAAINSVNISATAKAAASVPGASSNVCILALSTTATPGLLVNSGVNINAPTCQIDVKSLGASSGAPAATFNSNPAFALSKICIAGSYTLNNPSAPAQLQTGCATAADPFAGTLPTVTVGACTVSNQNYTGNVTLNPGVYCGNFNFNSPAGTITFNPGLYIFKGVSWNINTGWSMVGNGVSFYFEDSSYLQINSGVSAYLSAPTSGTYANILMFEKPGLTQSAFTINGSAGHAFSGLIYLPSRDLTFNAVSSVTAENLTIVLNSVILDGCVWNLNSSPRKIPAAGATSSSARLVP